MWKIKLWEFLKTINTKALELKEHVLLNKNNVSLEANMGLSDDTNKDDV